MKPLLAITLLAASTLCSAQAAPSIEGRYWAPSAGERWALRLVRAQAAQYERCKELERTFKGEANFHVAPCSQGVPIAPGAAVEPGLAAGILAWMRNNVLAAHHRCDSVAWAMGPMGGRMPQVMVCTVIGAPNVLYWAKPGEVRAITPDELTRELEKEGLL